MAASASHSDAAKMEQIITEFFAKSLHIILESRDPSVALRDFNKGSSDSSPSSSSVRPRDKWFNLALKECPSAFENLDLWCWSNPESMVVDVILVKRVVESVRGNPEESTEGSERSEQIIERWVVKYEIRRTESEGSCKGRKRSSKSILSSLYKKSIIVLRSLYTTVRLLPAYKVFRQLRLSGSLCSCFLAHRVSPSADPFDPKEEAKMQLHGFAPLDTSYGKLQISVLYLSRISGVAYQTSSMPMAPKFISDYVGSSLAEPVKRLPSLLGAPGSFPSRQYMLTNYDHCQAFPPSFTSSHSSTHSDACALPLPYPLISSSNSDRVAGETARLMQDGAVVDKLSFLGKNEHDEKKPARKFQDESDYSEITCVFDVAHTDPVNLLSRESEHAAVGALVDTFQKAEPLSRQAVPRATADDAFREFQGFMMIGKSLKEDKLLRGP